MHSLKAYIVEDSPLIRDSLIAMLEELVSVKVVGTAEDEAGAVQWILQSKQPVDLMIIDVFLKSGSGLGVLRAASALPPSVKRVVLSNYATVDMRRKGLALGADRVFDKSHDIDALIAYCSHLSDGADGLGAHARAD